MFLDMIGAADALDKAGRAKMPSANLIPRLKVKTANKHFSNMIKYWK